MKLFRTFGGSKTQTMRDCGDSVIPSEETELSRRWGLQLQMIIAAVLVALFTSVSYAAVPNPGEVSDLYKVGYQEFRVVDSERPRIPNGQGRLLNVGIWYPVDPEDVGPNPSPAKYYGEWLLPGDFIPDGEVLDDIAAGNLTGAPPAYFSDVAIDGSNLLISFRAQFPIVIITPSATIPIWTFAKKFAEVAASHGLVVIAVDPLIGHGWRTRLGFPPAADLNTIPNRKEDIRFIIDLMANVERWTGVGKPDPALDPPNNLQNLVLLRGGIDKDTFGIFTASAGGDAMFEYVVQGDPRLKALGGFHTSARTLTSAQLAQVDIPLMLQSGELDTAFPPPIPEATFEGIGTPSGKKYLIETLRATHFHGITCEAADGFFGATASYMSAPGAAGLSNIFAGIFNGLCLTQTDISNGKISSGDVTAISVRELVAFYKVYLAGDGRYNPVLTIDDALKNNLPVIYHTSDSSAHDTSSLPVPNVDDMF